MSNNKFQSRENVFKKRQDWFGDSDQAERSGLINETMAMIDDILNGQPDKIIALAEKWGKHNAKVDISNKKGRQVFDTIIGFEWEKEGQTLYFLRPRLAYMAAREPRIIDYQKVIDEALKRIGTGQSEKERREKFENLKTFVEAVLAYTKYNREIERKER